MNTGGDWSAWALNSPYHFILLLPVISAAATSLGVWGTVFFTVIACLLYSSFYFLIDQTKHLQLPDNMWPDMSGSGS